MLRTSREKVVKNAEKYVSRGKIEAGIKEYLKLLDENPNDISTLNRVGDLYARIDRNSEAIELFQQIAEQYADDGFLVKAIAIYKKIIKLDPTRLEIYEKLADLYHRQGLVNEARTQYQVLADYYLQHDKKASAVAVYERMVDLDPDDPSHRVKLADLYEESGRIAEAMTQYRGIAELMLDHGRGEEAAQVYEKALAVSAEDVGFITDAVLKLKEAGHVGQAARLLTLATDRNPAAERVARIAGLDGPAGSLAGAAGGEKPSASREEPSAGREEPSAAEEEPSAVEEEHSAVAEDPSAAWGGPSAEGEEPSAAQLDPMAAEGATAAEPEIGTAFGEDDLSAFELELDEEDSGSLVQPPADMLEDRERRGFAWGGGAPASEPPREAEDAALGSTGGVDAAERGGDDGVTGTFEFELDLDADPDELLGEEPSTDLPAVAPPESPAADELDHDLLERTAAEVEPPQAAGGTDDLFTEAEVLAKYGIAEKALDRLAELLHRDPGHLEAYALMVTIHLDSGRHDRAAAVAARMAEVAEQAGDRRVWPPLRERLEEAGHRVEGHRVEPPPDYRPPADAEQREPVTEVSELEPSAFQEEPSAGEQEPSADEQEPSAVEEEPSAVEEEPPAATGGLPEEIELSLDEDRFELPDVPPPGEEPSAAEEEPSAAEEEPPAADTPPAQAPPRRRAGDVAAALAELAADFLGPKAKRSKRSAPPPAEPPPAAGDRPPDRAPEQPPAAEEPGIAASETAAPDRSAPVDPLRALGDSLRDEIDQGAAFVPPRPAATPSTPHADAAAPSESPGKGLEDSGVSWLEEVSETGGDGDLFEGEEGFFDLGAELEQELTAEESLGDDDDLLLVGEGPSLEDIVEGFKRGVSENLSTEDYDTHYNLGIAYREMGLLDEAIGEFQLAAKGPGYTVPCASMLGLSFLEKGHPDLAVKWYRRGLEAEEISEEDQLGLLYDLGNAQESAGDVDAAYETFVELYGVNTNYRDVVARLAELEPRRSGG